MNTDWTQAQMAEGTIRRAMQRLAGQWPFHVRILEQFQVTASARVPTMGVTIAGANVALLYDPAFVLGLPMAQLTGVLLHEVHHVLFGHLLIDPEEFPDAWALVMAEEVTVNEFIRESLPRGVISLKSLPGLPPMESTRQRYTRLRRVKDRPPLQMFGAPSPGQAGGQPAGGPEHGRGPATKAGCRAGARPGGPKMVDDHSAWPHGEDEQAAAEAAVRDAIRDAALASKSSEIPEHMRKVLETMGIGTMPGDEDRQLSGEHKGLLPWPRLLRMYVGQTLKVQPDFRRPSRRLPDLVGIVPGRRHGSGRPRIMAAIDTSGSLTPELLDRISAELRRLAADFEVLVVECDCAIRRVYAFKPIRDVVGGGGTDFRPPLDPVFLRRHRPDLVVYFTDGCGPAPAQPPHVPVVWCLTPGMQPPSTWGRVIQMLDSKG